MKIDWFHLHGHKSISFNRVNIATHKSLLFRLNEINWNQMGLSFHLAMKSWQILKPFLQWLFLIFSFPFFYSESWGWGINLKERFRRGRHRWFRRPRWSTAECWVCYSHVERDWHTHSTAECRAPETSETVRKNKTKQNSIKPFGTSFRY